MLLADVIQALDEAEEGRRAERNVQTQLDKRLKEAGESIKNISVQLECRRHPILTTDDNNRER